MRFFLYRFFMKLSWNVNISMAKTREKQAWKIMNFILSVFCGPLGLDYLFRFKILLPHPNQAHSSVPETCFI